ncbi:RNA polymerase sigma factor [Xanthomonas hortorum pv. vitians]|uniref:RNA polymerase sigma factor n=1 Tax=Xanthomonas hortorum pv. vitians TaxID=83224 RepID=A0A6V7D806_9XANT|nr:sigma-70 family RNA polymerase sigma factor [Xanthomonas hortorum]APP84013.1 RNA polymerase subunit sigma-70 [Xanthomonas hortorum pv. gardneri]ASW46072.1 RNA polymerase subunit sigma-70 [Xanthomonas hortorum]MCC8493793.1 sigma-70 family RNA polymerase sigma factor [Xanthomonas hortorum pv. gardneri]MCE4301820.1 sigma-70 family RNA polymerase sigma factor [Xanthomonas hortorum pv. vitians]MCE4305633.1 sigma-70 family RNA polymerase sigma factor [Xanthomonas hortorum pv. vitians]
MHTDTLDLMLQRELPHAAAGCQQAYGRIVRACQNTVTAIALAITRDIAASEDIAQEAFLRAWQRLAQLSQPASFLPWLRQITRNLARDWLRANRHRALSGEAADLAIAMAADPAPSPAEHLLQVEEEIAALDIISALPEESRETLLLYYREGQSSQQVASLLGLSDAAVRKRLSRARASVREELLRRFGAFARGSAPSVAFATAVTSATMLAAPGTASAAIVLGGIGGAGKLGMGGLTSSALSGGGAAGALSVWFGMSAVFAAGSVLVAALGTYWSCWYLLRFAETAGEVAAIRRFIRISTMTAALVCCSTLLLDRLDVTAWAPLLALCTGMLVVNYQSIVVLTRVMRPMLARDARKRGAVRAPLVYRCLFSPTAVLVSTAAAVLPVLHHYMSRGML